MSQAHETGALRGKLRETEAALAAAQRELKETQARLDATLRLQRPGALPLAHRHSRELSTSSGGDSAHSAASTRLRESPNAPNLIAAIQKLIAGRRRLEPEDVAAGVLQAQLRGFLQRRRYRECAQLHAGVSGSVELRCGGRSVTGYVITVVRNGCCWEVVHRFSEWRDLHKRLGAVLAASAHGGRAAAAPLPHFPARLPFGGASVVARRQYQLTKWLIGTLSVVAAAPRARALLLAFLCRSHMHWLYPAQPSAAQRPATAVEAMATEAPVRDASSGLTSVSAVRDENVEAQVRALGETVGWRADAPRDVRAMRGSQASYASIERQLSRTTLPEPELWPWQRAAARARMISEDDGGGIGA